jgi:hypothetical protein
MNDRDAQLDEETRELLLAEKRSPGAPREARARVLSMLQASLAAPAGAPQARPTDGPAGVAGRVAIGKVGPIAVAFLVGGAAGVSLDRWLAPAVPPRIISTQATSSAPVDERVERVEVTPSTSASAPPPAPPKATSVPSSSVEADLGAERELLDRARSAFAAGDPTATLAAVGLHAKRFPSGRLEEEREALAVKALVGAGRYDEARLRAARFRSRFPHSFLSPTIEEALRFHDGSPGP